MDQNIKRLIYSVEEIFEEIPGDPDNIILKFPPEVLEHTGWLEGDDLDIKLEEGTIIIKKHG